MSGTGGTLVFQAQSGNITDPANAAVVNQVVQNVSGISGVEPVVPAEVNVPPIQFAQLAGRVSTTDPSIAYFGLQFTDSSGELARTVTDEPNLWDELEQALAPAQQANVKAVVGGPVADIFQAPSSPLSDHADDIGLALAVVVLLIALGAVVAMFVPIGVALFGVGVAASLTILLEHRFEIGLVAPVVGMMLGLGVGIDYSLFILSRYRQGLLEGRDPEHAVGRAMATSGSAVLFAAITVCLAMVALGLMGVPYVRTLGLIAALYVVTVAAAALTFLPALLGALGTRVNKGKMPWHRRTAEDADASRTLSARWAHEIARRPWLFAPLSLFVLLLLASPLLKIQTGFPDDGSAPTDTPQRQAYDLVEHRLRPGCERHAADRRRAPVVAGDQHPATHPELAVGPAVAREGRRRRDGHLDHQHTNQLSGRVPRATDDWPGRRRHDRVGQDAPHLRHPRCSAGHRRIGRRRVRRWSDRRA